VLTVYMALQWVESVVLGFNSTGKCERAKGKFLNAGIILKIIHINKI